MRPLITPRSAAQARRQLGIAAGAPVFELEKARHIGAAASQAASGDTGALTDVARDRHRAPKMRLDVPPNPYAPQNLSRVRHGIAVDWSERWQESRVSWRRREER
jgi:hypothetical protein